MPVTIPLADAKTHLSALVDKVVGEHERFVITRHGRPAAVLVSPDELEALEETVDILQDGKLLESIRNSREEAARGKRLRFEDQR